MFLMSLWRTVAHRNRLETDLDDEMRAVYEMLVDEKIKAGARPAEARRAAALKLGGVEQLKEHVRDVRAGAFVESVLRDIGFAVRALRRSPGFSTVAILTLALGIGANTAIFSLLDGVIFKPLPVNAADQLFVLSTPRPDDDAAETGPSGRAMRFSYPAFLAYAGAVSAPASLAAMSRVGSFHVRAAGEGPPRDENIQLVSGGFFSTFPIAAERGRLLTDADERDAAPVAVLSDFLWRRRFGASDSIIGRAIEINGVDFTVVGIVSPPFTGAWTDTRVGIWIPTATQHLVGYAQHYGASNSDPEASWLPQDGVTWLTLVARAPSADLARTRSALTATHRLDVGKRAAAVSDPYWRARTLSEHLSLEPFARGFSGLRDRFSQGLLLLMAMVCVLLLIACANIANLLLARATARQREIGIRRSLGASRLRLIQQLLIENVVLSLLAGIAGIALGYAVSRILIGMVLNGSASGAAFSFDVRVLIFATAVTIAAALLAGLIPAMRASSSDITRSLAIGGQRAAGRARIDGMRPLVVLQVALSLVLVLVAAISARSLLNLLEVDPGFDHSRLLQATVDPKTAGYTAATLPDLYARLAESVRSVPGVASTAFAMCNLANDCQDIGSDLIEGYQPAQGEVARLLENRVTPDYFATVGMRLLSGRSFDDRDSFNDAKVAIVNEAAMRKYFHGTSPIGKRIGYSALDTLIVGVVRDARVLNLRAAPIPMAYYPLPKSSGVYSNIVVKAVADPGAIAAAIPKAIAKVDPDVPVGIVRTLDDQLDRGVVQDRLIAYLTSAFGAAALLLAAIGLYGVMAYGVARRTSEIGVRMAIGARSSEIFRLVIGGGLRLAAIGVVAGLAAGFAVTRLVSSFLFGVSPFDPVIYAIVVPLLLVVTSLACYFPARRATRLDPIIAVRYE